VTKLGENASGRLGLKRGGGLKRKNGVSREGVFTGGKGGQKTGAPEELAKES